MSEFNTQLSAPVEYCDCQPQRRALVVQGDEMQPYVEELLRLIDEFPADGFPLNPRLELVYIARCCEYPNGCGWIEGTWDRPAAGGRAA